MISNARLFPLALASFLVCLACPIVVGTTIDPWSWEQLARQADLVAVVQCTTAGGIVARYKVQDVWKGRPPSGEIAIRMGTDYWGEAQYPLVLCDEKLVVFAFKHRAESRLMSTSGGGLVPLWWRQIPADYSLPLHQGAWQIPDGKSTTVWVSSRLPKATLPEFKGVVIEFLKAGPDRQELELLKSLTHKYVLVSLRPDLNDHDRRERISGQVEAAQQAEVIFKLLVGLVQEDGRSPDLHRRVRSVFAQAAGPATQKFVEAVDPTQLGWTQEEKDALLRELQTERQGSSWKKALSAAVVEAGGAIIQRTLSGSRPAPDEKAALEWRSILTRGIGEDNDRFDEAFEILTLHDPAVVCEYLARWKNPHRRWQDEEMGYTLGSYLCWRCTTDRRQLLTRLLNAQEGDVRVAAAVYLCFEDLQAGEAALRRFVALSGHAGYWAALTLVRRGNKEVMPRALEILKEVPVENMTGVAQRNLQKRLMELISNSAHAAAIPLPPAALPPPTYDKKQAQTHLQRIYDEYVAWWKEHGEKVALSDPWLPVLQKQKVD